MTEHDVVNPALDLNVASLVEFIKQSPYLYARNNEVFAIQDLKHDRWEEIGLFFEMSGEDVMRFWVKSVVRYKQQLKKLIAMYLCTKPIPAGQVGPWFDIVGELVGVTFEQIEKNIDGKSSLEENFNYMFRL